MIVTHKAALFEANLVGPGFPRGRSLRIARRTARPTAQSLRLTEFHYLVAEIRGGTTSASGKVGYSSVVLLARQKRCPYIHPETAVSKVHSERIPCYSAHVR